MSFWRIYYHIVWGTKRRKLIITPEMEAFFVEHFHRKADELGLRIYALNGWTDHIHMVVSIPPKVSVAEAVKRLKGSSSHDWNLLHKGEETVAWAESYGVFSLGERQRGFAEEYVRNQKSHHQDNTTNAWLEREDDEGRAGVTGVKEQAGEYVSSRDEMPF